MCLVYFSNSRQIENLHVKIFNDKGTNCSRLLEGGGMFSVNTFLGFSMLQLLLLSPKFSTVFQFFTDVGDCRCQAIFYTGLPACDYLFTFWFPIHVSQCSDIKRLIWWKGTLSLSEDKEIKHLTLPPHLHFVLMVNSNLEAYFPSCYDLTLRYWHKVQNMSRNI